MPRVEKVGKKPPEPSKILHMSLPDEETLAFWKMTADDPHEYAARIARFSKALGKAAATKAVRPSERRWQDAARATQSRCSKPLGKLLTMPSHPDVGTDSRFDDSSETPDQSKEGL